LETAINALFDQHNANPKPFRWIKSADDILAVIERFCTYNTSATRYGGFVVRDTRGTWQELSVRASLRKVMAMSKSLFRSWPFVERTAAYG
jgi:hypothetical protein